MSKPHRLIDRFAVVGAVFAASCLLAGCALSGTWEVYDIAPPPDASVPVLECITFAADGRCTVTKSRDQRTVSHTGQYQWNGFRLVLKSGDGEETSYRAQAAWDGASMQLTDEDSEPPRTFRLRPKP